MTVVAISAIIQNREDTSMRKQTGVYIYLGRELYESIKAKASKKGLTAGEFCAKLVKKEALRSHRRIAK